MPQYYQNQFVANQIRPRKKTYSVPEWFKSLVVGNNHPDGKVFTNIKLWLHKPSIQFPTVGLFISFSNGNASCFARLRDVDEIHSIINFLSACIAEITPKYDSLKAQAENLQHNLKTLEDMRAIAEIEGEAPQEDEEEEAPIPLELASQAGLSPEPSGSQQGDFPAVVPRAIKQPARRTTMRK